MSKVLLLILISLTAFSQDYRTIIEKHRENYKEDFLKSNHSPLKKEDLESLRFYEPNEKYNVLCEFLATKKGKPFELPTSSGKTRTYLKYGELYFEIDGLKQKISVYQPVGLIGLPPYKDYLFIPFKDLTNGKETYSGGRYLDLRTKEIEDNKVYLDFNKAYNPYCAFSEGYSCPIPPKENHLKIKIEAGEKSFSK